MTDRRSRVWSCEILELTDNTLTKPRRSQPTRVNKGPEPKGVPTTGPETTPDLYSLLVREGSSKKRFSHNCGP